MDYENIGVVDLVKPSGSVSLNKCVEVLRGMVFHEATSDKEEKELNEFLNKALLALEQKEKLSRWLDDVEGFETKEFIDTLEKTLYGKLVGTCKVREIMNLKKERVGEQK